MSDLESELLQQQKRAFRAATRVPLSDHLFVVGVVACVIASVLFVLWAYNFAMDA